MNDWMKHYLNVETINYWIIQDIMIILNAYVKTCVKGPIKEELVNFFACDKVKIEINRFSEDSFWSDSCISETKDNIKEE